MMGERTVENITELAVAIRNRRMLTNPSSATHPYPTDSSGVQLLAKKMAKDAPLSRRSGKGICALSKLWL
jgi:hypothetical protein